MQTLRIIVAQGLASGGGAAGGSPAPQRQAQAPSDHRARTSLAPGRLWPWDTPDLLSRVADLMCVCGGIVDADPGTEKDPGAIALARFAVAEHNTETNAALEFERLVKVRRQPVEGTVYYFTVEARDPGGAKRLYEAKVWERPWMKFKKLVALKPIGDATTAA